MFGLLNVDKYPVCLLQIYRCPCWERDGRPNKRGSRGEYRYSVIDIYLIYNYN